LAAGIFAISLSAGQCGAFEVHGWRFWKVYRGSTDALSDRISTNPQGEVLMGHGFSVVESPGAWSRFTPVPYTTFDGLPGGCPMSEARAMDRRSNIVGSPASFGQKALKLVCEISPDVPDALTGDPGRFRQILINLVGNAIKFTARGRVLVRILPEERQADSLTLHITIADTGIGIPPKRQKAIFAPFEQADKSVSRKYGGTGLGLAISRELVKLLEGRIWLESPSPEAAGLGGGPGSSFHFTGRFGIWLPEQRALVFADALTAPGGELRVWISLWHEQRALPALRALLELPFEHVIVSHGEPVHTRAAYERALESAPWKG
jgi:hypothetical protein